MLKFVYGSTLKGGPKDWYLELTKHPKADPNIYASWYVTKKVGEMFERSCGHLEPFLCRAMGNAIGNMPEMMSDPSYKYMNRVGGFTSRLYGITEKLEVPYDMCHDERIKIEFPPKKEKDWTSEELIDQAKISKWPNGSHYYAVLPNGEDVVINGNVKWNNRIAAAEAVESYVKQNYDKKKKSKSKSGKRKCS